MVGMDAYERSKSAVPGGATSSLVHTNGSHGGRAARAAKRIKVRRGIYVSADSWGEASSASRYLMRVQAVLSTRIRRPVLGYWSAAAVWGYPRVDAWPADVHLIVPPQVGAHSKYGIRFHREGLSASDLTEVNGVLLTTPARTLVDLARTESFRDAVVAMDAALNPRRSDTRGRVSRRQLELELAMSRRGTARAARAAEFGDGRAANPGETLSRVVMLESGVAAPRLQTEHPNPDGGSYFTDFEWPEHRVIGEFDGRGKYLKDEFLGGRSPGEVVYEEKRREDHLRAEGNRVVRWGWRELHEPGRLLALLSTAGVPYHLRGRE